MVLVYDHKVRFLVCYFFLGLKMKIVTFEVFALFPVPNGCHGNHNNISDFHQAFSGTKNVPNMIICHGGRF